MTTTLVPRTLADSIDGDRAVRQIRKLSGSVVYVSFLWLDTATAFCGIQATMRHTRTVNIKLTPSRSRDQTLDAILGATALSLSFHDLLLLQQPSLLKALSDLS